jgi:hypothetical protein
MCQLGRGLILILHMMKGKINISTFCFLEKQGVRSTLSDASCSDDKSLLLVWDDEHAAKFAVSEKKKHSKVHKQREMVCQ